MAPPSGLEGPSSPQLVFDLDGLLLDSESDLSWLDRALSEALRALDLPVSEENRARLYPIDVEGFERVAASFGLEAQELWRVRNGAYTRVKVKAIEDGELAPFDDLGALYSLADRHSLHVISNSPQEVVEAFVRRYGYDDLFSVLVGRHPTLEAINRIKPHPHLYERLVSRAGGGEYTYIGHTDTDRRFAANAGMAYLPVIRDGGAPAGAATGLDELAGRLV